MKLKRQDQFLTMLEKKGTIWAACRAMKPSIDRHTVQLWRKEPAFEQRFRDVRLDCVETVETGLYEDAQLTGKEANDRARKIFLAAEKPDKYTERKDVNLKSGSIADWLASEDDEKEDGDDGAKPGGVAKENS